MVGIFCIVFAALDGFHFATDHLKSGGAHRFELSLFPFMINLNYPLLKPVRMLMLPFSLVYGLIIYIRNWMFDRNILRSASFNLPLICIGNLAVGGTGKSPMVEFLIGKLRNQFQMAILSRGYKRKTSGYALATAQ